MSGHFAAACPTWGARLCPGSRRSLFLLSFLQRYTWCFHSFLLPICFISFVSYALDLIKEVLSLDDEIQKLATELYQQKSVLIMGRGYHYSTCLEGALVRNICPTLLFSLSFHCPHLIQHYLFIYLFYKFDCRWLEERNRNSRRTDLQILNEIIIYIFFLV